MFKNLSKKTKILISLLFVVSIISTIWIYSVSQSKQTITTATPKPVKYNFVRAIPLSGSESNIPPTSAIDFYFSKPILESSADVIVTPEIPLTFSSDTKLNAFYIRAIPSWKLDTRYTIKINIKSNEGESLDAPIEYSFTLKQMKDSLLSE